MKIAHIISSIDVSKGGPSRSVTHLIEAIFKQSQVLNLELDTLESENPIVKDFESYDGKINFHKHRFLNYSKSLANQINNSDSDLFHGHGLWEIPIHQMASTARQQNKPYIITPRGMLEPWALGQGKLRKKFALTMFQYKDLEKATCLHATACMEVKSIRSLGLKNPIAMIPNGVKIDNFPSNLPDKAFAPKKILFLSRIHPKKGIENLIEAWHGIELKNRKNWFIEIIGNGDVDYVENLKQKINYQNLQKQIIIKPPVFGQDKIKAFREASLFVLPTYSENFGIVVAEALASYTPVITTKGAPWEELNTRNAGWWIDIGVEPLKKALQEALLCKETELLSIGANGRKLIEDKYSMAAVAKQMIELYQWILIKGKEPEFVNLI